MSRPWRLTPDARASLVEIARWTAETFGRRQAVSYREDLLERCEEVAAGTAFTQDCRQLIDPGLPDNLRYTRSGQHVIVFVDNAEHVTVVGFLHTRSDVRRRLIALAEGIRDLDS